MDYQRAKLKWNGWGWLDQDFDLHGREEGLWEFLQQQLGVDDLPNTPAVPLEEMPLPESRLSASQIDDLNALLSAERPALLETDAEGHTVLHALLVTMFSEKGGQIARLVDWRANTSRRTIYRYDVLRAVARQARPAIHRILQTAPELAKRASPRFGVTPLHLAVENGHLQVAKALLAAGASVSTRGWSEGTAFTAFDWAVFRRSERR